MDGGRVATEHAGLLRLLQQAGEHTVHIERLGVARHALREAPEQRRVLGVEPGLGVEQVEQRAAETG
jgi:hypothetical protein